MIVCVITLVLVVSFEWIREVFSEVYGSYGSSTKFNYKQWKHMNNSLW